MRPRQDGRAWKAVARRLGIGQAVARKRLRALPDDRLDALEADPPVWLVAARARMEVARAASRAAEARRRRLVEGLAMGVCGVCNGQLITRPALYDDGCLCDAAVGLLDECVCPDPERVDVAWCGACGRIVTAAGATCRPDAVDSPFSFDDLAWW